MQAYLPLFLAPETTVEQRVLMENDLIRFGLKVASKEYLAMNANAEDSKPWLEQFDAWGQRVDRLHTGEGWKYLKREAAVEQLIHLPYKCMDASKPDYNPNARLHQVVKLMLFQPSSGMVSCPLAMTDGAAFTLRELKKEGAFWSSELEKAYEGLTSKDPGKHWTSGQWMTEKRGGSDVSRATDTFALEDEGRKCRLYGYKWFSSATDSEMSLALARIPKSEEELLNGTGGLAMVFLRIKSDSGKLNNIEIVRLKDKLGTRQLPTAELVLRGTTGLRVSEVGQGVKQIANMLTVTRIHNSLGALGYMRRILALAYDFKERRVAFGKALKDHHLHMAVLGRLEKTYRGNLLFLLECSSLLQLLDKGDQSQKQILRLFTPVLKLFTAKEAVAVCSEGLETFGGVGYMENSRIPVILRDAQVLPIWEGTTNILSLDFAQEVFKNFKTNFPLLKGLLTLSPNWQEETRLDSIPTIAKVNSLQVLSERFLSSLNALAKVPDLIQSQARTLAFK